MANIFYVYILRYPNGIPFYVGKGKSDRILEHEREARSLKPAELFSNPMKIRAIRKVWKTGKEIIAEKVARKISEERAFEIEKELIAKYGIRREGGSLCNLTYGGEGFSGFEWPWEEIEERRFKRSQLIETNKNNQIEKSLKAYVKAYAEISKKLSNQKNINDRDKLVITEAYSEAASYLARKKAAFSRETNGERDVKGYMNEIKNYLSSAVATEFLVKLLYGCFEISNPMNYKNNKIGKIKAKNDAKNIKKYAMEFGYSEEEADKIASEKSMVYIDRKHTGKYGKFTKFIEQKIKMGIISDDPYKLLSSIVD